MSDIKPQAEPQFSSEDAVRDGIELLFFAYRDFTAEPDAILARYGFGRAHHRVIHFVGRHPQITVSELLGILRITKQSLSRVLGELVAAGFDRPAPAARTTAASGCSSSPPREARWSARSRRRSAPASRVAYRQAGAPAVEGFRQVLLGIIAEAEDRRRFAPATAMKP